MLHPRLAALLLSGAALVSACKKDKPTGVVGPPTQLTTTTATVSAPANTAVQTSMQVAVRDADGNGVSGETVTFQVISGGGSLVQATAVSGSNGSVSVPEWTFGKSDVEQRLRAVLGTISVDIVGSVATSYDISVRFFGASMTQAQKDVFTNAAARLQGIITGDLPPVQMNQSLAGCVDQSMNEIVDDVVIFASVQPIDGSGNILASAGPCFIRQTGAQTVIGLMQFDVADFNDLADDGTLQEVITHEMLHVIGIGSLWDDGEPDEPDDVPLNALLQNPGTSNPRYTGAAAREGCAAIGGSVACATSVPVENTGGPGTADAHWRETTFEEELLTGFSEGAPGMPLSRMTVGALADLGYTVNTANFDTYSVFLNAFRAGPPRPERKNWERAFRGPLRRVDATGKVTMTKRGTAR